MIYGGLITKMRKDFFDEYKKQDYESAVRTGEQIAAMYERSENPNNGKYGYDIYNLACAYDMMGDTSNSLEKYNTAMHIIEKNTEGMETKPVVLGHIYSNMAILNTYDQKYDNVANLFEKAYEIYEENSYQCPQDFAGANYNMGSILYDTGHFRDALYYYTKAYNIIVNNEALFSTTKMPDVLCSIGYCYESMGETEHAYNYLKQALDLVEARETAKSREYVSLTKYIALLLHRRKRSEEAIPYFLKAISATKAMYSGGNTYIDLLNHLSDAYGKTGEYEKAINTRLKALSEDKNAGAHLNNISTLMGLIALYQKTGEYNHAIEYMQTLINIHKFLLGETSHMYIDECIKLSDLYIKADKREESFRVLENLVNNKGLNARYCRIITSRLVRYYEETRDGNKLNELYKAYLNFFPDKSFEEMLNEGERNI